MTAADIVVELRLADSAKGKAKAFADVTVPIGADGMVTIHGFAIYQNDDEKGRVAPPARPGAKRYFDVVTLTGKIRALVEDAILAEYWRQVELKG